jgi:hypothetical protein
MSCHVIPESLKLNKKNNCSLTSHLFYCFQQKIPEIDDLKALVCSGRMKSSKGSVSIFESTSKRYSHCR